VSRLATWLRRLAGVLLWAWATYQVIAAIREWWRSTSPARIPDNGYPNTYGIRIEPLTPAETREAIEDEYAIARRLGELAGQG